MPGPTRAVTAPHTGKKGRPSSLSKTTVRRFTRAIMSLNTIEDAANIAGIDRTTVNRWLLEGKRAKSGDLRDFYVTVEEAKAKAKDRLVGKVSAAAQTDPAMALKILERRYPTEWSPTRKIEFEEKTPPQKRNARGRVEGLLDQIAARLTAPPPALRVGAADGADDEDGDV